MFERGDRVKYTAHTGTEPYDPLHGLVGTVTHFDGDENGEYNNLGDDDIWVEFDNSEYKCWVRVDQLSRI